LRKKRDEDMRKKKNEDKKLSDRNKFNGKAVAIKEKCSQGCGNCVREKRKKETKTKRGLAPVHREGMEYGFK